jgi:LPS-assembly protein
MLIASPNGLNSEKIPNLDSQNFEFDETNLFSSNRFTGYDRYETGPRAIYGLKWAGYSPVYGNASATIGQTYRLHKDSAYNKTSGLAGNWSDYVLQMSIEPSKYLYLDYRGRLDRRTLLANQSEVNAWVGTQALSFGTNYILINQPLDETNEDYGDREEITAYATSHFSEFWKATISTKHDLRDHGGALENKIQLDYENECCILSTAIKRDYTTDDDVDNDYSAYITFTLKTLGQIKSGSN